MIFNIPSVKKTEELEDELRLLVSELNSEEKKEYYKGLESKLKDPDTFAVLSYFIMFGLQNAYAGRFKLFFGESLVAIVGLIAFYSDNIYGVLGGALMILLLAGFRLLQLFFSQRIIADLNYRASLSCYKQIVSKRKST